MHLVSSANLSHERRSIIIKDVDEWCKVVQAQIANNLFNEKVAKEFKTKQNGQRVLILTRFINLVFHTNFGHDLHERLKSYKTGTVESNGDETNGLQNLVIQKWGYLQNSGWFLHFWGQNWK